MTIGIGYFVGGLVLVLYSVFCFYVGFKRPEKLFRVAKLKFGKDKEDAVVSKICYVWALVMLAAGIAVFVLGYLNA